MAAPFISLSSALTFRQLPAAIVSGSPTHAVATVRITNHGNISSIGPITIAFSASPAQDVPGTSIISITKKFSIKPNASATVTVPLKTIPALADGDYFIVAQITDPDQNTAVVSSATPVTAAAPVRFRFQHQSAPPSQPPVARGKSASPTPLRSPTMATSSATGPATFDLRASSDGQTAWCSYNRTDANADPPTRRDEIYNPHFQDSARCADRALFPAVLISNNTDTTNAIGLCSLRLPERLEFKPIRLHLLRSACRGRCST